MGTKEFIIILLACYATYATIQWKKYKKVSIVFMAMLEKNGVDLYSRETVEQFRDHYINRKM